MTHKKMKPAVESLDDRITPAHAAIHVHAHAVVSPFIGGPFRPLTPAQIAGTAPILRATPAAAVQATPGPSPFIGGPFRPLTPAQIAGTAPILRRL